VNTLPLWLQITGLAVGAVTGVAGIVLSVLNVIWRRRDTQPRLLVEANVKPASRQRLELIVRNKGRVIVTVAGLRLKITHPDEGSIDAKDPYVISGRGVPLGPARTG
jgi:hypothetical protein